MAASIVIIVENLPVPFDRRVWQEATALQRAGYIVSVICPTGLGHDKAYEELEGVHVYRHDLPEEVSSAKGYLREYAAALREERRLLKRVQREHGIDLVHLCNPPDVLFLNAVGRKWFRGTKVIFDHHDRTPELYVAKYGRKDVFHTGLSVAEWMTFHLADVVIAPNETHAELAETRGGNRPDRVFIVRSSPASLPEGVAHDTRPGDGLVRIGYVGVMGEQDGVDLLVRAAERVVKHHGRTDARFVLIGGGPAFESLVQLRNELGLEKYVEFAGYRPRAEVVELLAGCDVCVGPDPKDEYNDGCTMNKVLEYMQLGKPMVQFDLVESRRIAGEAAVYAEENSAESLADGIVRVLDDPELAARIGALGRERFESLTWAAQVDALLAAYACALGASAPGA